MRVSLLVFLMALAASANAQLLINPNQNVASVLQNTLLGPGVEAFNISVNGDTLQVWLPSVAAFECVDCNLGMDAGMAISTGAASGMAGPNNATSFTSFGASNFGFVDTDLMTLVKANGGNSVNDITVIEFDFVAPFDTLSFEYVWASEEYNSYVSSQYNDVFGFFLSGPGISGPFNGNAVNLAVIPGAETPVSVNTINNGEAASGPCMNCEFFNQPYSDDEIYQASITPNSSLPTNEYYMQYDGYTDVLTARSPVICGETYHVKIAICDASDQELDSGVFLKQNSFTSSYAASASLQMNVDGPEDNTVYELCSEGAIRISLPGPASEQEVIQLQWLGNAMAGEDYQPMPDSVVFAAGESYVDLPFALIQDIVFEGLDTVLVVATRAASCSGLDVQSHLTFFIADFATVLTAQPSAMEVCAGMTYTVEPELDGGFGNYTYEWNTGATTPSIDTLLTESSVFTVTISDACGMPSVTAQLMYDVIPFEPLTVFLEDLDGVLPLECDEFLPVYPSATGGVEPYVFNFYDDQQTWIFSDGNTVNVNAYFEGLIYADVTDYCGNHSSDSLLITANQPALYNNLPDTIEYLCGSTVFLDTDPQGGYVSFGYGMNWYVNGEIQNNWNATNVFWAFDQPSTVIASVSDNCFQTVFDTCYVVLAGFDPALVDSLDLLSICDSLYGCLNPLACNYEPLATYEDASCYEPTAILMEGPLAVAGGETSEYSVVDYFPGSTLVWFAENGTILSQSDSLAVVEWNGNPASLCAYEMLGETCQSDTTCITIDVIGSVEINDLGNVSVYPNPASDFLQVQLSKPIHVSWSVLSSDGRMILTGNVNAYQIEIPTQSLAKGAYVLQLTAPSYKITRLRFVKE